MSTPEEELSALRLGQDRARQAELARVRLATRELPTAADTITAAQIEADALLAHLEPIVLASQDDRAVAKALPRRQASIDFYKRRAAEAFALAEKEDLAGHPEAALVAYEKAETAQHLYLTKVASVQADTERIERVDWKARDADVARLTSRLAEVRAIVADPTAEVARVSAEILDAWAWKQERDATALANELRALHPDPKVRMAMDRAAHEVAAETERAAFAGGGLHKQPIAKQQNGAALAALALARLRHGRVDPVLSALATTGGPNLLQSLDPQRTHQ
jgi:hypothetical protein